MTDFGFGDKVDANDCIRKMVAELMTQGYRIRWFAIGISRTSSHLCVQDYVTGTVSDEVEDLKPPHYKKLRKKVRR